MIKQKKFCYRFKLGIYLIYRKTMHALFIKALDSICRGQSMQFYIL